MRIGFEPAGGSAWKDRLCSISGAKSRPQRWWLGRALNVLQRSLPGLSKIWNRHRRPDRLARQHGLLSPSGQQARLDRLLRRVGLDQPLHRVGLDRLLQRGGLVHRRPRNRRLLR